MTTSYDVTHTTNWQIQDWYNTPPATVQALATIYTSNQHDYVWINEDLKVVLNSDHTLTQMIWDGSLYYNSGTGLTEQHLVKSDTTLAGG